MANHGCQRFLRDHTLETMTAVQIRDRPVIPPINLQVRGYHHLLWWLSVLIRGCRTDLRPQISYNHEKVLLHKRLWL